MTTLEDDRTLTERETHQILIGGTDRFMSGWGGAKGGMSYAFWACEPGDYNACESWVRQRGDIMRVREVGNDYRPGSGCAHCHVYVWRPHSATVSAATREVTP